MVRCLDSGFNTLLNALKGGVLNPSLTISELRKIRLKNAGIFRVFCKSKVGEGLLGQNRRFWPHLPDFPSWVTVTKFRVTVTHSG
jgi:hypothetical protein